MTDERRWHVFQRTYDRALATARAQVSETAWATAWAAGRALTAEQAVAEALVDVAKTPSSGELVPLVDSDPIYMVLSLPSDSSIG